MLACSLACLLVCLLTCLPSHLLAFSLARLLAYLLACQLGCLPTRMLTCSLAWILVCSLAWLLGSLLPYLLATLRTPLDSLECCRNSFRAILSIISCTHARHLVTLGSCRSQQNIQLYISMNNLYRSIGSSCTSHSQTIKGGEISLKMINGYETLRPSRGDSDVVKSAVPDPRSRIPRGRTLEKLLSSSYFLEVGSNIEN